jgi:hypothetical protein
VFAESSKTVLFRNRDDRLPQSFPIWYNIGATIPSRISIGRILALTAFFNYLGCLEVAMSSSLSELRLIFANSAHAQSHSL